VAWLDTYQGLVSSYLRATLEPLQAPVYQLCKYHLGWIDESGLPLAGQGGKMLRPSLCLAACRGYGSPELAVGMGAALELLHAFSLAHDDIEDGDRERRHRPTLWAQYGIPLALNAGDALYSLAYDLLCRALDRLPEDAVKPALAIFSSTCLRLVEGQHLDLEFESRPDVDIDEYVEMVRGKTGALLGASLGLGALCGRAPAGHVEQLRAAGVELGLAFQARDDTLAFWGDPAQTGKAAGNDLARGKKSLPVVLARSHRLEPAHAGSLTAAVQELEQLGVRAEIERFAGERAASCRKIIGTLSMDPEGRNQLLSLVELAVSREA
jgi:geranylgeranyl diphosphate synthase, type I